MDARESGARRRVDAGSYAQRPVFALRVASAVSLRSGPTQTSGILAQMRALAVSRRDARHVHDANPSTTRQARYSMPLINRKPCIHQGLEEVAGAGIEPATRGFSVLCSAN